MCIWLYCIAINFPASKFSTSSSRVCNFNNSGKFLHSANTLDSQSSLLTLQSILDSKYLLIMVSTGCTKSSTTLLSWEHWK